MSKLDVSSGPSSLRLQVNTEAKLKALLEISQNLGKALGLDEVLPKLLDSLFTIFLQADRGFIVLRDPQTGRLVPKAVKHRRHDEARNDPHQPHDRQQRDGHARRRSSRPTRPADSRFDMAESIVDFHIRSMMCAPLIASDGEPLGVIQIDTLDQRNRFNRDDLDVLASVACQAAFAVENAQLHEAALREQAIDARVGRGPRGAAGLPALGAAATARVRFLRVLRAGQPAGRRLLRLRRAARRAAGASWWPTCRARAFRPRC